MKRLISALGLAVGLMIVLQAPWLTASTPEDLLGSSGGLPQPMASTVYPWPMYTYNATHSSMTKSPSPNDASVSIWNATGPNMYGSPTIAEGKVFIGMGSPSGDSMLAFHVNNLTRIWRRQTTAPVSGGMGVTSTPAYSNGVVFFAADQIYALYASNGAIKWTYPVANTLWGSGTPTVAQGKVFVGGADRYLYVLDENTGALVWRFLTLSTGSSNYGLFSPPVVTDKFVYLAGCDGYVYQIYLNQTGPTAVYFHRSPRFETMYGSPLLFDGKIFIGDGYTGPDPNARFRALSATDLSVVWTFTPSPAGSFFSSAAVAYGKIFIGSTNGFLYALDPWTKAIIWSFNTGGVIWSSPAISDGKVFIGSESNNLYSFNANQTNPATARWSLPLGGDVDSAPAISDGRVCVGTWGNGGRIYCIGSGISPPVNNPPTITLTSPGGTSDWTGGSMHLISWTMSDDTTPVDSLVVYLNYTSTPSSGAIAGPLRIATSYDWTVPPIDANDVLVNATVIDQNGLKGYSTALVPKIDSTPPAVVSAMPTGTGVALNAPMVVQFSESMNTASVETVFTLIPYAGPYSYIWSQTAFPDDTVTIDHNDFSFSTTYDATVFSGARDASDPGIELLIDYSWSFTTIVNALPTISISAPTGGESWTGGSVHNVAWTASDAEDPPANLMVWVNYSITGGGPYDRQVPDLQGVSSDSSPYAWTVPLEDSTTVVLSATAMDTTGGKSYASSAMFEIDSTAPNVAVSNPWGGATGVPIGANVVVIWSEWMDDPATESAFSLQDTVTWTLVPGSVSWVGNIMTFDPTALLLPGVTYSANITVAARDDSQPGNHLAAPEIWTFTTAAVVDTTKPTLMDATAIPDPQEVYLPVNVSAIVQDDVAVGLVRLNVTDPVGGTTNTTMLYDSVTGRYYLERNCDMLGVFTFAVWASDTSGNWNSTPGQFTCQDTTPPAVWDLTAVPNPVEVFTTTNLSALASDNYMLSMLWVLVTAPDLTVTNLSMAAGPRHSAEMIPDQLGDYAYRVYAMDSVGLQAAATGQFHVGDYSPPVIGHTPRASWMITAIVNITANVTDNVHVQEVWLNFTDTAGVPHNVSMTRSQQDEYFYVVPTQAQTGTLDYHFRAVDQSGNWAVSAQYSTSILQFKPDNPTSLVATLESCISVRLHWIAPTTNEDGSPLTDLVSYNVYRSSVAGTQGVRLNTLPVTDATYLDSDLGNNVTYYYTVRAVNSLNVESEQSNVAYAVTAIACGSNGPADTSWLLWILAVLLITVIVASLLIAILLARRKKKEEPAKQAETMTAIKASEEVSKDEGKQPK